jgi:hypothetical protein
VLEDATVYSEHAGKTRMDVDDVRLATQSKVNFSFTAPPPREFMMELASKRNAAPLPAIPPKLGVRLPLERYCLSAVNYSINGTPETPAAITSAAPPPAVVPKNAPAAAKKPKACFYFIAVESAVFTWLSAGRMHGLGMQVELKTAAPLKRAAEEDDDWD